MRRRGYPAVEVTVSDEGSLSTIAAILAGTTDAAFVGPLRHQIPAALHHQVLALEPGCAPRSTPPAPGQGPAPGHCEMRNPADLAALALTGLRGRHRALRVAQAVAPAGQRTGVPRLADP